MNMRPSIKVTSLQWAVARPQVAHSPNFPSRTGEIVARAAIESHPLAVLAGNDAEAIVLDLVQPLAAGRQLRGLCRKARRDEPGRQGTLQHNADS